MTEPVSDKPAEPIETKLELTEPSVDLPVVQHNLAATAAETIGRESKPDLNEKDQKYLERLVESARSELALKYEKYGAKPEDFRLVTYYDEERGDTVYVVVFGAPNGLDLGDSTQPNDRERSWDTITKSRIELQPELPRHVIEIGKTSELRGSPYDDRTGMTLKAYEAFIEAEKAAGRNLPDSDDCQVPSFGLEDRSRTLLTGEDYRESSRRGTPTVPIAEVRNGEVFTSTVDRYVGSSVLRFRPAVELDIHGTGFNLLKPDSPSLD